MVPFPSETRRHVDPMPLFQGHDRALGCRLLSNRPPEGLELAFAHVSVDALDFHVEELLYRFLDLRLGGVPCHSEHDLIVVRLNCRLFRNHRGKNQIIVAWIGGAHFSRASNASKAALVNTSTRQRRMS